METEFFIWTVFKRLRRRRFPLGVEDYQSLRQALQAGFGWSSPQELRILCCALWAKSRQEQETVSNVFRELTYELELSWELPGEQEQSSLDIPPIERAKRPAGLEQDIGVSPQIDESPEQRVQGLPRIQWSGVSFPQRAFSFVPQFPVTFREIVQAWRRLRRPIREGAKTELDIEATVTHRSRLGVPTPAVLVPPRRNRSRLLLLVDREGSMTPFHQLVEEFCSALQHSGRLEQVEVAYFHDVPAEGADERVLDPLSEQLFPELDPVLAQIEALHEGHIYPDPAMSRPESLSELLENTAVGADVVIISDGGAARRRYDLLRLLDTIAFIKGLRNYTERYVWLNPLPEAYWKHSRTTAAQIARHVPMFALDREGMHHAVNVLHGKPYPVERPV